jgi:hypothetical protein
MATWFNLRCITAEIPDRHNRGGPLALFSAALFTAGGRQLTMRKRAVSLAGALTLIAELGMFRAPEPRLMLHIRDPIVGDAFLALSGPLESDNAWAEAAIEQLKASEQFGPADNHHVHQVGPS